MKTTNTTQWEVTKYGQCIKRSDIERGDIGIITIKTHKYLGKYYVEVWRNGRCLHFDEVI